MERIERFETHSHSMYSNIRLIDSINRPKDMILKAYELGLSGLCITDHEALCGHVDFLNLEKELKEQEKIPENFKIGLGNEIYLTDNRDKKQRYYHFILIAKDTIGHKALRELSSIAWYNSYYDRGMERVPTLKSELKEIVLKYKGHLISCTACLGGELATLTLELVKAEKNKDKEKIHSIKQQIVDFLQYCIDLFGEDFYIEIAPSCSPDQIIFNKRIKKIAKPLNLKMIFATDAHYLTKENREMHKAYLNSKNGEREVDDFYAYAHLMNNEEAFNNLYPYYTEEEFKEMCENTMEIYSKIKEYDIFHKSIIPKVEVKSYPKSLSHFGINNSLKDELDTSWPTIKYLLTSDNIQERYWINQCLDSLYEKRSWENNERDDKELIKYDRTIEDYLNRIEIEADIIKTLGDNLEDCLFSYFNTFQHYINLFWECGSIVGPGRGSAVGFLTNYLLGITQLDPIKWRLPYWRLTLIIY